MYQFWPLNSPEPQPEQQFRHFKGNIYTVIGVTTTGECPYLDAVHYFTCVHTETGSEQWFDAVMTGQDDRMWLFYAPKDAEMRRFGTLESCHAYPHTSHVLYSRPEDGGKVWARPLTSWLAPVPPANSVLRWLFWRGLWQGRQRFTPI